MIVSSKVHHTTNLLRNLRNWHRIGSYGEDFVVAIQLTGGHIGTTEKDEGEENKKLRTQVQWILMLLNG